MKIRGTIGSMKEKEFGGPIGQKYAEIDLIGREALDRAEIKPFEGFGENIKNRFIVALQFAPESEKVLETRVTSEVERIGRESGIEFFLAGKDFPIHSTLGEGLYEGGDVPRREDIFREVHQDEKLKALTERKRGERLIYKYLLLDKGNVMLTSVEIPEDVGKIREELAAIYAGHNLKPLRIENLLHVTVGRITKIPDGGAEQFREYKKKMIELRHRISEDPLRLEVKKMSDGPSYEFLQGIQNKD